MLCIRNIYFKRKFSFCAIYCFSFRCKICLLKFSFGTPKNSSSFKMDLHMWTSLMKVSFISDLTCLLQCFFHAWSNFHSSFLVHNKFGLPSGTALRIYDDTETEIEEDILHDLLHTKPDIMLTVRDNNTGRFGSLLFHFVISSSLRMLIFPSRIGDDGSRKQFLH